MDKRYVRGGQPSWQSVRVVPCPSVVGITIRVPGRLIQTEMPGGTTAPFGTMMMPFRM